MPDISMCPGGNCMLRLNCHRCTATPSEYAQSYFVEPPYKLNMVLDDKNNHVGVVTLTCAHFWNNNEYKDEKPKYKN